MDNETVISVLGDVIDDSRERDYRGYDKHDGMSNVLFRKTPLNNKWVNIALQESIKRAPVNIRPLFGVEKRRNFLSIGIFATVNFRLYDLTGDNRYLNEGLTLSDWLVNNTSPDYPYFCGGHPHKVQSLNRGVIPENTPDVVCTFHGVEALKQAAEYDSSYVDEGVSAAEFVKDELTYNDSDSEQTRLLYRPDDPGTFFTINANAVGARLLATVYQLSGNPEHKRLALEILDYVASLQSEIGGWKYREPASSSHLSMDNYHNGFIIESFINSSDLLNTDRYADVIDRAVAFYRETLYNDDGSPNWDESNQYPKDIHAAAQGITVFSMIGQREFAEKIIQWTLNNLYNGSGRFHYQVGPYMVKRFTLMRWCQAWMAYALSTFLSQSKYPKSRS